MFQWLRSMLGFPDPGEVASLREELAMIKASAPSLFPSSAAGVSGLMGGSDMGRDADRLTHNRGWVFACVRAIASRIAGQQIKVGRKTRKPARGGRKLFDPTLGRAPGWIRHRAASIDVLDDHPLLDALDDPNDVMVQWSLLYVTVASLELTGKAYLWCHDDGAGRLSIWPIPSHWVTPLHGERGHFDAYRVQPPTVAGEGVTIAGQDVIRFNYPDPSDPLGSVSPLSRLASAVRADEAIGGAQEAAFKNGVKPGVVLTVGPNPDIPGMTGASGGAGSRMTLSPHQRAGILHFIRTHYRGFARFDEPLILDNVIQDAKRFDLTPQELDFLNSAAATKARVCQGFGVNPIIIGDIQNSNRAAALAASDQFNEFTINPKIELISQTMTSWFAYRYRDRGLLVWVEKAEAIDAELELKKTLAVADRGGLSIDELRQRLLNLPPVAGGHVAFINPNLVPYEILAPGSKPSDDYNPFTDGAAVGDNGPPDAAKAAKLYLSDPDPEPAGGRGGVDPALNGRH